MAVRITRRDFLNGVAVGADAGLFGPVQLFAQNEPAAATPEAASVYYPPTRTGMRGSHEGSFEVAHALAWRGEKPAHYRALDEHYDLVIVGAGMSGLAAAWFYRKKMGPDARILLLDNHDDFGGHAKRNEFHHEDRMLLSFGGAQNLENPGLYSDAASGLLDDLDIDTDAMAANMTASYALVADFEAPLAMSLPGPAGHVTVRGNWIDFMHGQGDYAAAVRGLPLPAAEQDKLISLFGGDFDYLDELSLREKYAYAKTVSYNRFLEDRVGLAESTLPVLNAMLRFYSGLSGWNLSVLEAFGSGAPGLRGMGWLGELADSLALSEQQIHNQLQALLGAHGFSHESDIRAITVNRWPHGYAYNYMALDDPEWAEDQAPHELGRAQFGPISIANSDSEARAYMDAAIDAAWRAVEEQTAGAIETTPVARGAEKPGR